MKSLQELLDTPGVKGVIVHEGRPYHASRPLNCSAQSLLQFPEWALPRKREVPRRGRIVSKIDMREPVDNGLEEPLLFRMKWK